MKEEVFNGIKYQLNEEILTADVIENVGRERKVDIPEVVVFNEVSYRVTSIGSGAFSGCYSLTSIVIPESVTSIKGHAFYGCSSLEIVHLPAGVSNFEIDSFKDCPNLKAIYAPKNKVEYYKELFPADMHWLIVEEGSDLPVKP